MPLPSINAATCVLLYSLGLGQAEQQHELDLILQAMCDNSLGPQVDAMTDTEIKNWCYSHAARTLHYLSGRYSHVAPSEWPLLARCTV